MSEKKRFNVLEHQLVPEHRLLTREETEEVLKKYRVKLYQLPRIRASDPAAQAIGAKPGDVVGIARKSSRAGIAYAYRYVTE